MEDFGANVEDGVGTPSSATTTQAKKAKVRSKSKNSNASTGSGVDVSLSKQTSAQPKKASAAKAAKTAKAAKVAQAAKAAKAESAVAGEPDLASEHSDKAATKTRARARAKAKGSTKANDTSGAAPLLAGTEQDLQTELDVPLAASETPSASSLRGNQDVDSVMSSSEQAAHASHTLNASHVLSAGTLASSSTSSPLTSRSINSPASSVKAVFAAKNGGRKVTMQDVARHAGVSYQTVSRVLNTPDKVSEATRRKIDQAIAELKYVPNLLARQLGKAERNVIGVVNVPRAMQPSTGVLTYLKDLADKHGYKLMLVVLENPTYDNLKQCMDELHSQMISKVLINAPLSTEIADRVTQEYQESKLIFLDVDPLCPVLNVCFNPLDGTLASIRYLKELGHKKIVIIRGPSGEITSDLRYDAWVRCAKTMGLEIVAVEEGAWTSESGYNAMQRLIDQSCDFTAVVSGNDEMALGAEAVLNQYDLRVPQDVSVIGYDNIVDSAFFLPALTTVNLDRKMQIEIAFRKLISDDTSSSLLPTNLVIRQSCCPPRANNPTDFRSISKALRNIALRLEEAAKDAALP